MTACFSGGAAKKSKEWSYTYTATDGAYPILLLSVSHHMRTPHRNNQYNEICVRKIYTYN